MIKYMYTVFICLLAISQCYSAALSHEEAAQLLKSMSVDLSDPKPKKFIGLSEKDTANRRVKIQKMIGEAIYDVEAFKRELLQLIHANNELKQIALNAAIGFKKPEIVFVLLQNNVKISDGYDDKNPFVYAVTYGHVETLKVLLKFKKLEKNSEFYTRLLAHAQAMFEKEKNTIYANDHKDIVNILTSHVNPLLALAHLPIYS